MTPRSAAAIAAVGLVGAALLTRRAADGQAQASAEGEGDGSTALDYVNPLGYVAAGIEAHQTEQAMQYDNTAAFLSLIAYSEGTNQRSDPYRVCYGYAHTINSFADHPAVTREWGGERLPDSMCRGAGLNPGCVSTAAGRYQIIKPTWLACKRALGLVDFSPASQDAAAVHLIRSRGAMNDVIAGNIEAAIAKCSKEWASLPGAGYGQPERKMAALIGAYQDAGGWVA